MKIRDDRTLNRVEVTEQYTIEPAFVAEDDGSRRFDLNPHVVASLAKAPKLLERSAPLAVTHPRNVRYNASVLLPEAWKIENETVTIEDPAFFYRSQVTATARRFSAQYDFRTLADHVDAAAVPEYARKLERVRDDTSYWFKTGTPDGAPESGSTNIMAILAVLAGAGAGWAVVAFLRRHVPKVRQAEANAPSGIAGWLILPTLHTCLVPIAMCVALFAYGPFFDVDTWNAIGSGASALAVQLLKIGYFAIIAGGVTLLIASSFAIFLLFGRRRVFPFAYILITWSSVAWLVLNLVVVIGIPSADSKLAFETGADAARSFISGLIWTAYMVRSQRVAATFVRDGAAPAQPAVAAVAEAQ